MWEDWRILSLQPSCVASVGGYQVCMCVCVCAHFCFVTHTDYLMCSIYSYKNMLYTYIHVPLKCRVNTKRLSINTCTSFQVVEVNM